MNRQISPNNSNASFHFERIKPNGFSIFNLDDEEKVEQSIITKDMHLLERSDHDLLNLSERLDIKCDIYECSHIHNSFYTYLGRQRSVQSTCNSPASPPPTLLGCSGRRRLHAMIYSPCPISTIKRYDNDSHELNRYSMISNYRDIEYYEPLGYGNGGIVYKAKHVPTGIWMAVKTVYRCSRFYSKHLSTSPSIDHVSINDTMTGLDSIQEHVQNEVNALSNCTSPFIVTCYGTVVDYQNDIHLCMEWMDQGSLDGILKRMRLKNQHAINYSFNEKLMRYIMYCVLNGLVYLHERHGLLHRDVKPSNILLDSCGRVKLCDLGVSGKLRKDDGSAKSYVGSSAYMAPERILGQDYSLQADSWSLGMTILELGFGEFPLLSSYHCLGNQDSNLHDIDSQAELGIFEQVTWIVSDPMPRLPEIYSEELCNLVSLW